MKNSFNCRSCEGCKHITNNNLEYCYMFQSAPSILPCAQHDKYAEQRKINGRKIYANFKKRNKL